MMNFNEYKPTAAVRVHDLSKKNALEAVSSAAVLCAVFAIFGVALRFACYLDSICKVAE